MKKSEIKVGGLYKAKVNNVVVTVRVDKIRENRYDVTNLKTKRTTTFRSAAKFREEVLSPKEQDREPTAPAAPLPPLDLHRDKAVVESFGLNLSQDNAPHVVVQARAGTGKTTTLISGLQVLKGIQPTITPSAQQQAVWDAIALSKGKAKSVAFVAFNKSIADELKSRVPEGCDAMTMHSMGLKAIKGAFKLDSNAITQWRVTDIICELLGGKDPRELRKTEFVMLKATQELVSLCKMNLTEPTPENLSALAVHYDVELNSSTEKVFGLVPRVLEACKDVAKDGRVDFDDMIWLPVVLNLPLQAYDLLLIDERQDLNKCQMALALKAGRRIIAVGDDKQAIYGFAGADANACKNFADMLQSHGTRGLIELPLTVTRRCGKAIVAEAQHIVPDFEAHESNGTGEIKRCRVYYEQDQRNNPDSYESLAEAGDMILCRVNAPLVSQCFRFLKAGRRAFIQGRKIGEGLISTIKKQKAGDIADLQLKLSDWLNAEVVKERAKRNPSDSHIINLRDRYECILYFLEDMLSIDAAIARIESVFKDQQIENAIRLSSIHKAKGLEANRVFLLEPEGATVPHPMAKSAWQREQEMNLRYVAITRAIRELVYVSGGKPSASVARKPATAEEPVEV